MARRRLHRPQRLAARADDGICVSVPGKVRAALQRRECRARNRGRDLTPEPGRDSVVVATMYDERPLADEGKVCTYVKAIDHIQQRRSGLGGSGLTLQPCEVFPVGIVGSTEKDVTEQARAQPPMRAYRRRDRLPHARSRKRRAIRIRPVQHQLLDALRKRCGESDGGATPRRAADERYPCQLQLVQERAQRRNLTVEAQIRISHRAIRHTDAEPVVADQAVSIRDSLPESPKARALPVKFEVTHPPRRSDERWTVPTHLVRHAARAERQEPNLGLLQHRPDATHQARVRTASASSTVEWWTRSAGLWTFGT